MKKIDKNNFMTLENVKIYLYFLFAQAAIYPLELDGKAFRKPATFELYQP